MPGDGQQALLCGCGSAELFRRGFCRTHYWADQRSQQRFGGWREQVLIRDGRHCLACGEFDPAQIVVHHRMPDIHRLPWLLTLCRACHARIHHTWRPRYGMSELLRTLWREQYRGAPEQLELALFSASLTAWDSAYQVSLFEAA